MKASPGWNSHANLTAQRIYQGSFAVFGLFKVVAHWVLPGNGGCGQGLQAALKQTPHKDILEASHYSDVDVAVCGQTRLPH